MSVAIDFKNTIKRYGDVTVIDNLSFSVKEGEFFTLLGPSGCGKTTLLRMLAGFNSIEGGEILIDGKVINNIPPHKRNIGMVFQNYAIFPHMTVFGNVAYGLKVRKIGKKQIEQRVNEILKVVQIEHLKDRFPKNLSGGQQQRVALARAIVIHPSVLLMDEPLSNLDAKLRVEMRSAIKKIQKNVGITTIYVTHDQEEALAISDRIAVMNFGKILQVGTPEDIYLRPANLFVANFIVRSNILDAKLIVENNICNILFKDGYIVQMDNVVRKSQAVKVAVRPEELVLSANGKGLRGKVLLSTFLGQNVNYEILLDEGTKILYTQFVTDMTEIIPNGEMVCLSVETERINVFDETGNDNLILKENSYAYQS